MEMKDHHRYITVVAILLVVLVGVGLWALLSSRGANQGAAALLSLEDFPADIPVENIFPNKIVYTTDVSFPVENLQNDCQAREGAFNACGTSCREGEVCVALCAYTCEF